MNVISDYWGGVTGVQTKYDPCPAGWRVAPSGAWYFYTDSNVTVEKVFAEGVDAPANKDLLGRYVSTDGGTTKFWFPAQGEVAHAGSYGNGIGTTGPVRRHGLRPLMRTISGFGRRAFLQLPYLRKAV